MNIKRLLHFAAWPTAVGVIIALSALLIFPQLRGSAPREPAVEQPTIAVVSYADAVSRAAPAVVNIYTEKKVLQRDPNYTNSPYYRHFFNNSTIPLQERMQKTLGSGVIVDASGLILTNNHVINGADKINVLLYDGRITSADLIGVDPDNDLAVLKIGLANLTPITAGQSSNIRVGDVVLAIGNPFGVGQSVSQGIVSAKGRWNLGINSTENFIQTDAAINPGNSGGALVDARGNLIGINTAALDESNTASVGISFAVPADTAMNSLKQIVEYGEIRHGWLGVSVVPLDSEQMASFGTPGLLVTSIDMDGPAAKSGVRENDIITHISGILLTDINVTRNLVGNIQPGTEIKLRVLRNGKFIDLTATAGFPPNSPRKT